MVQAYHFSPHMYLEEQAVPLPKPQSPSVFEKLDPITTPAGLGEEHSEEEHEKHAFVIYIVLLTIMVVYVTTGTWMERRKCGFGHETGVVIILGIAIGAILFLFDEDISTEFSPTVLFDFGLPFILYAAGYNMRRRRFFDDINNITMFGVLSTVVCFIILSLTTIGVF